MLQRPASNSKTGGDDPVSVRLFNRTKIKWSLYVGHDQLIPTHDPKVISLLVKLAMSQPIVEPHPGFVQPPPPKVPYKEARYSIYSSGRLGPCAPADAGTTGGPDTDLEGHALLSIYLPG